jgi:hypothetical protein
MNRGMWTLSLVLALVWVTGALDVIHHLGESHGQGASPAAAASTDTSIGDPHSGVCPWCVALCAKCCSNLIPPLVTIGTAPVDRPLDAFAPDNLAPTAPHNRGPPARIG